MKHEDFVAHFRSLTTDQIFLELARRGVDLSAEGLLVRSAPTAPLLKNIAEEERGWAELLLVEFRDRCARGAVMSVLRDE